MIANCVYFQDPTLYLLNPIPTPMIVPTILQPQPPAPVSSSPAFLSRFPRSLSSLSLGGKRKSVEKENTTVTPQNPMAHADMLSPHSAVPASTSHGFSMASVKNKFTGSTKDLKHSGSLDQPPPLPQRNFMRSSQTTSTFMDPATDHDVVFRKSTQVSDLDTFYTASSSTSNPSNDHVTGTPPITKVKKRSKVKAKANSDPKISSHLFIQMEKGETMSPNKKIVCETGLSVGNKPPPLPPRQPGMIEENPTLVNKFSSGAIGKRPPPNSLDTLMNYPLIATCTAIKDNNVADNLTTDGHSHPQSNNNKHLHYSCSNAKSTVSNPWSSSSTSISFTQFCPPSNTRVFSFSLLFSFLPFVNYMHKTYLFYTFWIHFLCLSLQYIKRIKTCSCVELKINQRLLGLRTPNL